MWSVISSVGNVVGAMVEHFVPETSRRNQNHDNAQRIFDAADDQLASSMAFRGVGDEEDVESPSAHSNAGAPASDNNMNNGIMISPLRHFAEWFLDGKAQKGVLQRPVAYRPGGGRMHVYRLERDVYLVNAKLDHYYRQRIEQILARYNSIAGATAVDTFTNPWFVTSQSMSWTYEQEHAECEMASKCEIVDSVAPVATNDARTAQRRFNPNDWILYTRGSSAFTRELGMSIARDPLFDTRALSALDLGGSPVSFHVVVFMCGFNDEFVSDAMRPIATDASDTILNIGSPSSPSSSASSATMEGRRRYPPNQPVPRPVKSIELNESLVETSDWVSLPVWTWTMRYNGMHEKRQFKTISDLCMGLENIDHGLTNYLQRLQSMDPSGHLPVADIHGLKSLKSQLNAMDRFIGVIEDDKDDEISA